MKTKPIEHIFLLLRSMETNREQIKVLITVIILEIDQIIHSFVQQAMSKHQK